MLAIEAELRDELFGAADRVWAEHRARVDGRFTSFIPADYALAYEALRPLVQPGLSFVELGSGAGVVAILADLLGLDACGIELDPWLVARSQRLAAQVGSSAEFVAGTFMPRGLGESVEHQHADSLIELDGDDGWAALGRGLADFDLIYDYYWPDQADFHTELLGRARPGATVLRFSSDDGFEVETV